MRNSMLKMIAAGLMSVFFISSLPCGAQEVDQNDGQSPEPDVSQVPSGTEYRRRKLPNDVFKPSERISEDFPVPFPVDI